jgi:hypothetical protein
MTPLSVLAVARRVAFLGQHVGDFEDGPELLRRELKRLYRAVTRLEGHEPDLTFCCGCSEEIMAGEPQWILDGGKYHEACYKSARAPAPSTESPCPK